MKTFHLFSGSPMSTWRFFQEILGSDRFRRHGAASAGAVPFWGDRFAARPVGHNQHQGTTRDFGSASESSGLTRLVISWFISWGFPTIGDPLSSPWVLILKWVSRTWMIWGYPHGLCHGLWWFIMTSILWHSIFPWFASLQWGIQPIHGDIVGIFWGYCWDILGKWFPLT